MDADGDGRISYDEFLTVRCCCLAVRTVISCNAWLRAFARFVVVRLSHLPRPAPTAHVFLLQAVVERQLVHQQNAIWWAFCEYDIDGDGKIT